MNWSVYLKGRIGNLEMNVSLQGTNEPCALIGPNGSGKTTLLRAMAGACTFEENCIQIGEEWIVDTRNAVYLSPEKRQIGYLPQGDLLFPHLNVLDNVSFGLIAQKHLKPSRQKIASALLEQLGCGSLSFRFPNELSGGEKQKVSFARALLIQPQFLLLDEPFSALDLLVRRDLRIFLHRQLLSFQIPLLLVSHDVRDVCFLCQHVAVIEDGKVIQIGSIEQVRNNPVNAFVEEFFQ